MTTTTSIRSKAPVLYYQKPHQTPAWYKNLIKDVYPPGARRTLIRWYIKQRYTPTTDYSGTE